MVQLLPRIASGGTSIPTTIVPVLEGQKSGSLEICLPLAALLVLAWSFYALRRDSFPKGGMAYVILVALSFTVTSISMHTLNKVCVALTGAPSTLTAIQMAIAVGMILAMYWREVREADRKKVLYWLLVPVMYAGMLNSSVLGYSYLTLSLMTVFRNLAPLLTMVVEGIIMDAEHKPTISVPVVASFLTMIVGALLFSHGQGDVTWVGITIVAANTLLAIADRLLQRRLLVSECKDMPLSACMLLNNSFGMVPTFAMAITMHEVQGYTAHQHVWRDPAALVLIALSGVIGMGIGFFGLMCQQTMTATSFQVLQNMSKVAVVAIGIVVFGDHLDSPSRICGMLLSLLGSAAYGLARASEKKPQPADPADQEGGGVICDPESSKGEKKPLIGGRMSLRDRMFDFKTLKTRFIGREQ